jgi:cyclophilin family peptidyl-prolyl cis-trans isomerase
MLALVLGLGLAAPAAADDAATETAEPDQPAPTSTPAKPAQASTAAQAAVKDRAMTQIDSIIAAAKIDKANPSWRVAVPKPAPATFDPKHTYLVQMTTNKGPIVIKLMPEVAPMHVTSFIYLTKLGFYDGLAFHRVITNFMAQGGCPLGTGTGGPGYKFDGEFKPDVKHDKGGLLSMANAGPGTDGSQFFLTFVATPWLDGKHTIFGEVIEGMDTLKALEKAGSQGGATKEPLKMEKVTVEVK